MAARKDQGIPHYKEGYGFCYSMPCPTCGSKESTTLDSRPTSDSIRRRRACPNGHRYTTYERTVSAEATQALTFEI
jgi:hypothetical protein